MTGFALGFIFLFQALLLNDCNLLSLLIDTIIATNLFNGKEQFV